ncbi:hypothetical protein Hanom_Chr12g01074001 [Helianthus anomalus]
MPSDQANTAIKELLTSRSLTELASNVNSTNNIFDVQKKVLEQQEKNQQIWGKLLQEPKSLMRDEGINLMMDQSSSDHLVYSYLKDALETVQEKMEKSEKELEKIFKSK